MPGLSISSFISGFTVAAANVDAEAAVSKALGLKSTVSLRSKSPCFSDLYTGISSVLIVADAGLALSSTG